MRGGRTGWATATAAMALAVSAPPAFGAVTVTGESKPEGNSGMTLFRFVVHDPDVAANPLVECSYPYVTPFAGTAEPLVDYVPQTGAVKLSSTTPSPEVVVPVDGDTTPEMDETFHLKLEDGFCVVGGFPVPVTGGQIGTATILDDDAPEHPCDQPGAIRGTAANDVLRGTDGPDVICGLGGDDRISGYGGGDRLFGAEGADRIEGGAGENVVDGGDGADALYGGAEDDELKGGTGADQLSGGGGNDTLTDGTGNDVLMGGAGGDAMTSGAGDDTLRGGDGNDTLKGEADQDKLFGENGNDTLDGGDGDDALTGGAGTDTCTQGAGTGTRSTCEA